MDRFLSIQYACPKRARSLDTRHRGAPLRRTSLDRRSRSAAPTFDKIYAGLVLGLAPVVPARCRDMSAHLAVQKGSLGGTPPGAPQIDAARGQCAFQPAIDEDKTEFLTGEGRWCGDPTVHFFSSVQTHNVTGFKESSGRTEDKIDVALYAAAFKIVPERSISIAFARDMDGMYKIEPLGKGIGRQRSETERILSGSEAAIDEGCPVGVDMAGDSLSHATAVAG